MHLDFSGSIAGVPGRLETMPAETEARDASAALVADLFDRYQPAIFGYLCRMVGSRDWAEELTQEAFLRAHHARHKLPEVANRRAWLYRVATNVALNALKRRNRFSWLPWHEEGRWHGHETDAFEQVSRRTALEQALAALPPIYRAPLLLYSHYGFSVDEVAEALGIRAGAVKVRLFRARELFKRAYTLEENA